MKLRRISILSQVFPPEIHPSGIMASELAAHLSTRGWDVTVVCGFPHHPYGKVYPGFRKRLVSNESVGSVSVFRSWHLTSPSPSIAVRGAVLASQALSSFLRSVCLAGTDIVMTYGPPLFGGCLGGLASLRHGAKLVNVVYDVYPDIAIESGKLTNPLLIGAARAAERLQYRLADRTVVLSNGLKRVLVSKGVPESNVWVLPIWLDPEVIRPGPRMNAWRLEHGIPPEAFVVLYAGTLGHISGADIVVACAGRLQHMKDLLFLFVGEGAAKPMIETRVRDLGLKNVRILPFQPRERLSELQATADIGLVTLAPGRGRTSVPSKVLGYFAAARPVLASVDEDSDTGIEVAENRLGLVTRAGDVDALCAGILQLHRDPDHRLEMGQRAREHFVAHYSRDPVLGRFEKHLVSLIANSDKEP